MAAAAEEGRPPPLDPLVWKACAGICARIPAVGSLVYYFPQGHAEQASGGVDSAAAAASDRPYSLCSVAGVEFLASRETDEVYTRMRLDPRVSAAAMEDPGRGLGGGGGVVSFAKVLTPSDANNGGGFSVPRFCADSIFPPLNYREDPPVQSLAVRDVHGAVWQFRHIYRGTPRRHLLTTGWSRFVNCKKLVAGDSVVFVRNGTGELFVGVRRTCRAGGRSDFLQCSSRAGLLPTAPGEPLGGGREAFSRNCRGNDTAEAVAEAVRLAGMDHPFEVVYYPRAGSSNFVVGKEVVEAAFHVPWSTGVRVKMAVETEDSSRMTWYQGTVSAIIRHQAPFTFSPWRTLEVTWDEPDVLQNVKMVNPWEVELVSASPPMASPYPSMKKPRLFQNRELLADGAEQKMFFPGTGFSDTTVEGVNSSMFSQNFFPAGMQGARHDLICLSSLFNFLPNNAHQMFPEKVNCNKIQPKPNPMGLDSGSESQIESSSPPVQRSVHHCDPELLCNSDGKEPSKIINVSFQLFGKTIHMEPPITSEVKEECKDIRLTDGSFKVSHFGPKEQLAPPYRIPDAET